MIVRKHYFELVIEQKQKKKNDFENHLNVALFYTNVT